MARTLVPMGQMDLKDKIFNIHTRKSIKDQV